MFPTQASGFVQIGVSSVIDQGAFRSLPVAQYLNPLPCAAPRVGASRQSTIATHPSKCARPRGSSTVSRPAPGRKDVVSSRERPIAFTRFRVTGSSSAITWNRAHSPAGFSKTQRGGPGTFGRLRSSAARISGL